ncbi:MAG: glycogen/starch/alpha-glucan phosphorylase [Gammaproteobacteria bacterium]|nr:glycogen/starch/alpha-glucan phosphorylase [Gammaproteobacteria bacterium]
MPVRVPAVIDTEFVTGLAEHHLRYTIGKHREDATEKDLFKCLALTVRHIVIDRMLETEARYRREGAKRVYYLSMEFLIGRLLGNNLDNLDVLDVFREASEELGVDLDHILDSEYDPALGNGGLGRLAACFLDSLATMGIPGFGYGIHYEYGLFRQLFHDGYQRERPDHWAANDSPWLIERADELSTIPLYGRIQHIELPDGSWQPAWVDWQVLVGVPHDMPVVGYGGDTVNFLRLYSARASDDFDMGIFNGGDYVKAVEQKITSETVSKVLYPSDAIDAGRELRLIQEYFFVACAIRDIIANYLKENSDFSAFPDKVAIQLNDTHPALAVADLMRALVDEHCMDWDEAWDLTTRTLSYTNHTLLPEALEKWSVPLMSKVLPRHMEIIYEVNRRFMDQVTERFGGDGEKCAALSVIEESNPKQVRMANLAIVGSHSVNGVAALHSELVKTDLVPDFYEMWPEKFNNKTNGVTPRRWMHACNPGLTRLIDERIGEGWVTDLERVKGLEDYAYDSGFQKEFMEVKLENKERLAKLIYDSTRIRVDTGSLFDCQAKRMHEYKRQLLNVMHVIYQYLEIVEDGVMPASPRTYVFAGKAAPGYHMAKLIIKLINSVAVVINGDSRANDMMRVAFVPDYKVSVAERLIPAADLSEQISTAGFEASGTGNMKFAMNGALTIGTLDGANVEIAEEVGAENIYIFGLTSDEVHNLHHNGGYNPWDHYHGSSRARRIMDAIASTRFCGADPGLFQPIFDNVMNNGDFYLHLADIDAYVDAQRQVGYDYQDVATWASKAILNVARMSKFSSDRTIQEYASDIWKAKPVL